MEKLRDGHRLACAIEVPHDPIPQHPAGDDPSIDSIDREVGVVEGEPMQASGEVRGLRAFLNVR